MSIIYKSIAIITDITIAYLGTRRSWWRILMWWMELGNQTRCDYWTFWCSYESVQTTLTCLMEQNLVCRRVRFKVLMVSVLTDVIRLGSWQRYKGRNHLLTCRLRDFVMPASHLKDSVTDLKPSWLVDWWQVAGLLGDLLTDLQTDLTTDSFNDDKW